MMYINQYIFYSTVYNIASVLRLPYVNSVRNDGNFMCQLSYLYSYKSIPLYRTHVNILKTTSQETKKRNIDTHSVTEDLLSC